MKTYTIYAEVAYEIEAASPEQAVSKLEGMKPAERIPHEYEFIIDEDDFYSEGDGADYDAEDDI